MNPQYIYDNSTKPPTQSVLQYAVSPDTVYVSTSTQPMYANLTITVFNPSQTATVTCEAFQFGFLVGAEYGDLTTSTTRIQSSSDQTEWGISKQASEDPDNPDQYNYTVTPSGGGVHSLALAPEQSLYFHLNDIEINEAQAGSSSGEGVVPIFITEMTGADPTNPQIVSGQVAISKETGALAIKSFGVTQPGPFDPGAAVTLSWTLMGADHWQLFDYNADKLLYDSEKSSPPNANSYQDQPQRNTTYELAAFAGQLFVARLSHVMVRAARFVSEPYADPSEVEYNQTSMLNWQTQYASKLVITAPGFPTVVLTAPPGQYDLFLEAPDNQLAVPPNTYTLTAYGPGDSKDERQVTVLLAIPAPVINTFTATTPQVVGPGQSVKLSWGTSYGTIALLSQAILGSGPQPPQIVATNSSEYQGSVYPVQPGGISSYTLLLRGQGNQQVSSNQIVAVGNAGTFPAGKQPMALAYDGTYVWVTCAYTTVAALRSVDGTQPAKALSIRVGDLAFDGTNIWALAMQSDFDGFVTTLRIDGNTIQAGPGSYPVGSSPSAMTYDDVNKCLWAACGNDGSSVSKIRVSDGKILGTFPAGAVAYDVIFDGTYIWVADHAEGNLYVLNASDGSPAGEPFQHNPIPVGGSPSVLAYDGTYIWVADDGHNTLSVLRAVDGSQVVKPFTVGVNPSALCFDGTNVWLANQGDPHSGSGGGLAVMRMNNGAVEIVIPQFAVGIGPDGLTFDGTDMWVSNYFDGTLTKL